ncbi:type I-B CRISPR-associated protein Cas5 [Spirosoma sp. BT702]|uniref:Type I-B CRISPR-associated protein Cas5 n=1 Tax=Spirosoma profusum TaxID=2771354 RepID=A0A927AR96_9BACT|nr:type I-B CRISPR-associated protein Cas5b [Spirosoma profusum]MBD2701921.1 type I-B CRISPR-associated protein Cas5 [Spirosoma profusum]
MSRHVLIFDIWGDYAHFKKIYVTTSAVSYAIPPKTSLYGYIGAVLGLSKIDNSYLTAFADKQCLIGLSVLKPIVMKRLGTNLRPGLNRTANNPKPTMMEYVYQPKYRIYVSHQHRFIQDALRRALQQHQPVFSPSLGLASLVSNFAWVGEVTVESVRSDGPISVHSVIPRSYLVALDDKALFAGQMELIEQSLFAIEMNTDRDVTERDDILLERNGKPIQALVTEYYPILGANIILF